MITTNLIVTYLANIIKISQMDGQLDPREQEAVGEICQRLHAKESDLAEAMKKVAEGGHALIPVGRFSDKVRNLEDMLFVAMSDGDLSKAEKEEMLTFVKTIMLNQEQVKIILNETKLKISLRQTAPNCVRCGTSLTPDSKFCTSCGQKVGP